MKEFFKILLVVFDFISTIIDLINIILLMFPIISNK